MPSAVFTDEVSAIDTPPYLPVHMNQGSTMYIHFQNPCRDEGISLFKLLRIFRGDVPLTRHITLRQPVCHSVKCLFVVFIAELPPPPLPAGNPTPFD